MKQVFQQETITVIMSANILLCFQYIIHRYGFLMRILLYGYGFLTFSIILRLGSIAKQNHVFAFQNILSFELPEPSFEMEN